MDVDGSKPLLSHAVARERGHEVHHPGCGIDERRAGNPHLAAQGRSPAKVVRQRRQSRRCVEVVTFPKRTCAGIVRVHGIDAIVLGGENNHVMGTAADGKVCEVERLRHQQSVSLKRSCSPKLIHIDLGGSQGALVGIKALC